MIFTLFYAYATLMQWLRLRQLRDKLAGTLTNQNALLVCSGDTIRTNRQHRSLENLLVRTENRIVCTVVPKQKLQLSQWIAFPKNLNYIPLHISRKLASVEGPKVFVLLKAHLNTYTKHDRASVVKVENYGELVGWKAVDSLEILLKTNIANLTKLINQFTQNDVDINHDLQLLKIETVDLEGVPTAIKYDRIYLKAETLKFSYAPSHWSKFAAEFKELYSRIHNVTNPKIKIENGTGNRLKTKSESGKKHEVPEVAPKKAEDKNALLEVTTAASRSHKPKTKTKEKIKTKTKRSSDDSKTKSKPETSSAVASTSAKKTRHKPSQKLVKQSTVKENGNVPAQCVEVTVETVEDQPIGVVSKPPNVLVYADSVITKEHVKKVLSSILNKDKYTIYDLPTSTNHFWDQTTSLVVVCGCVPPNLTPHLIHYLLAGGRMLCLCSDFMYSVLHTFATAEVREHELVRFTYGSWKNVKMMHHIFCYQASPAKKQFSKDSDHSNHSGGEQSTSPRKPANRMVPPSHVTLRHQDQDHEIQVKVLGTEETWNTPSLLLAEVANTASGRAIFSQVHLEIDPEEFEHDDEKYASLKSSNAARLDILRDILQRHLHMECGARVEEIHYEPGYFLGRFDEKSEMISNTSCIKENRLDCSPLTVFFCDHTQDPGLANETRFPVLINSCPPNFSTLDYFETLNTDRIGRLVIYANLLTTTHQILKQKLRHGLVVIAARQTSGVGRAKNIWLSPLGSASMSLQLHIPLQSHLGGHLSIIQHLMVVAVVMALKQHNDTLAIGIKWPNDLYVNGSVKIGGVIADTRVDAEQAVVNVGCGVNLSNAEPTVSVNGLLGEKTITHERFYALVFNKLEELYGEVQKNGFGEFYRLYYRYWLHGDAKITVQTSADRMRKARVIGIDEFGFLQVKFVDGDESVTSLHPDGNSFDMMRGLIAPKLF